MLNRNWIFTINNPESNEIDFAAARYAVWQREKGENGTEHLQGYVVFSNSVSRAYVSAIMPRAYLEIRRGSHEQAKAYCTKSDTRIDGP